MEDHMTEPGAISAEMVKRLRDITGAGMMDCKRALEEASGDLDRAQEILREQGKAGVEKRAGRQASEGVVEAYIHGEGRVGVLVEVNCETDFVARTPDFKELAHEIALQVAATDPQWAQRDDVPSEIVEGERKIYEEQARSGGKPENVLGRIVDGKLEAFFKQTVLLEQPYIRDDSKRVGDLVKEVAAKVGENVVVRRFTRYALGKE
jgi:elongation factor Ts